MTIRRINEKDLAAVISLMQEFAVSEGLSEYCEITVERLSTAMFGKSGFVEGLISHENENPAGYALFYPSFSSFRGQRGMYLEDIYIKDEYRGKGLGKAMLVEIAKIAGDRGFERIDLTVLEGNEPAIAFYKKLGAMLDADGRHCKFTDEAFRSLAS